LQNSTKVAVNTINTIDG